MKKTRSKKSRDTVPLIHPIYETGNCQGLLVLAASKGLRNGAGAFLQKKMRQKITIVPSSAEEFFCQKFPTLSRLLNKMVDLQCCLGQTV
jgi:hypothetical protein